MVGCMELITIYEGPDRCNKCLGWKRVANDEDQTPWKHWAELAPPSNLAVVLGLVYPIECPRCHGSGREPEVPSLGTCSRCGSALDNVSPGFSLIAGGAAVCTPCLLPGEEIARARSL